MGINHSVYIKTDKTLLEVKSCLEIILNSTLKRIESDQDKFWVTLLGLQIGLLEKIEYKYESDYKPLVQHNYKILIDYIRPAFTDSYKGRWDVNMAVVLADMLSKNLFCDCFVVKNSEEIIKEFISKNVLSEIFDLKRNRVELAKSKQNFDELKKSAVSLRQNTEKHRLRSALQKDQINIIAEIKRASPSKGVINDKIDVAETVRNYEKGGACAISVLTEEDKFQGSLEDLRETQNAVKIPILRKDFIFDEFQIYEAAEAGADVILLIVAMLDDEVLQELYAVAENLGLDVLVEVHTLKELERAKNLGAKIIGVNNRDLHNFKVSLDVSRELIKHAPENVLMIAESGITKQEEILELRELGFNGFLIGETLMRSGNVEEEMKKLTGTTG